MTDIQSAERLLAAPPLRREYLRDVIAGADIGVVQKPLTIVQQIVNQAWLRKAIILIVIATAWQLYALQLNNPLMVPTFTATLDQQTTELPKPPLADPALHLPCTPLSVGVSPNPGGYKTAVSSVGVPKLTHPALVKLTFANETLPDERLISNIPPGRTPSYDNPNPLWELDGAAPGGRKIVPVCALSNAPARSRSAPVNEPRSWPKSSDSRSSPGSAAQLILTKTRPERAERA